MSAWAWYAIRNEGEKRAHLGHEADDGAELLHVLNLAVDLELARLLE